MSIYDEVVAEMGPAPVNARKSDFISYIGYADGVKLGVFDSKVLARYKGAKVVEEKYDEDGYSAAKTAYNAYYKTVNTEYNIRLRADWPEVNDAVFAIVLEKAKETAGHDHCGLEDYLEEYVMFAVNIIAASR